MFAFVYFGYLKSTRDVLKLVIPLYEHTNITDIIKQCDIPWENISKIVIKRNVEYERDVDKANETIEALLFTLNHTTVKY